MCVYQSSGGKGLCSEESLECLPHEVTIVNLHLNVPKLFLEFFFDQRYSSILWNMNEVFIHNHGSFL